MFELLSLLILGAFAYRLGAVVRDGREHHRGSAYLLLSTAVAFVTFWMADSVILAVFAGLAPVVMLAHAGFVRAYRLPVAWEQLGDRAASDGEPDDPLNRLPGQDAPDPLRLGMAFIGDVLDTADQLGELRHKRRLRRLERLRAEREAAQVVPLPAPAPPRERYIRVGAKRDPIRLLPTPKDPQEPSS